MKAPIYVKLEEYDDLYNTFSLAKRNIAQAKEVLGKIAELKAQEDSEIEGWYAELSDVETKMKFIDEQLFDINANHG